MVPCPKFFGGLYPVGFGKTSGDKGLLSRTYFNNPFIGFQTIHVWIFDGSASVAVAIRSIRSRSIASSSNDARAAST